MKRLVITGSSGSVGHALTSHVAKMAGLEIYPISRSESNEKNHIRCDVNDHHALSEAIAHIRPDFLIHAAGTFSGSFKEMLDTNVFSSANILRTIAQHRLPTRVVLIGTAAVYGAIKPHDNPVAESKVLAPVSDYGVSKAFQSQLVSRYACQEVNVVEARIFNLFGPKISDLLFSGRVQRQIEAVCSGTQSVIEVGNLGAIRDYLSLEIAVQQIACVMKFGSIGEVYHIASGVPVSMRQFLEFLLTQAGLDWSVVREMSPSSNHVGYDVPAIYADAQKIKELMLDNNMTVPGCEHEIR